VCASHRGSGGAADRHGNNWLLPNGNLVVLRGIGASVDPISFLKKSFRPSLLSFFINSYVTSAKY
jgi:hypothetical protein